MKTVAFTCGLGPARPWAERAARRFEELNGIETRALLAEHMPLRRSLRSPTWVKAFLWDAAPSDCERIVWLDADVVPRLPLGDLPEEPFSAVAELPDSVERERRAFPPARTLPRYFNAGFFVATRPSEPAFDALQKIMHRSPAYGLFLDQGWFNLCIWTIAGEWREITPEWCRPLVAGAAPVPARMIHVTGSFGGPGADAELARVWRETVGR